MGHTAAASFAEHPTDDRSDRYCIVGAGPSGLATACAFREAGIPFDIVERHTDVGGIWDLDNPGTPMYESAHFISSRTQSAFEGYPMPAHYADYPSRAAILAYIRAFADHIAVRDIVEYGASVERAAPAGDAWEVRLSSGATRRYRGVVAASGYMWEPVEASYPGTFDGERMHARHYRSASRLAGRRVLIVGGGNSGVDIACDAAPLARATVLSMRRGYYFLPKHLFGVATDAFFRSGPHLPMWLAQPLLTGLLRITVGDLRRYGLPAPDHKVLESHPIVNSQLLHYLSHGDVQAKPDVRELRGDRVTFTDDSECAADLLIYATGYRPAIPYIAPDVLSLAHGAAPLYLNIVPDRPGLFVIGLFATDGAAYPVMSRQATLVAEVVRARDASPRAAAWFEARRAGPAPDLTGGVRYLRSTRHAIYVQFDEYVHVLDRTIARMKTLRRSA